MEAGTHLSSNPKDWDNCQPYMVREMVQTYYENYLAHCYKDFLTTFKCDKARAVFTKLAFLYMK